jgi:pimeloyl-ACP methyl ester carboxylesterase
MKSCTPGAQLGEPPNWGVHLTSPIGIEAMRKIGIWLLAVCVASNALPTQRESRDELHSIPVTDAQGRTFQLQARVCRPSADAAASAVLINHGSPANAQERPTMQLGRCDQEAAKWFLSRGYVVVFALRRGYGGSGGEWAENFGGCSPPDYVRGGIETARDIDAIVNYATALPFVRRVGAVVVGQSAGGWGTIAYDSIAHPKVSALVVMAGGRGGHQRDIPNSNCRPDLLAAAAGHFGATAVTPMLWIYTANDSYFGPSIARALWHEFTAAGGKADFNQLGPYDGDGHHLFSGPGGSMIWGPLVERYLAEQRVAPN